MAIKDIIVRQIQDEDYLDISEWLKDRKWPIPPGKGVLPVTGYIAVDGKNKLAAGYLYVTNSSVGILDWLVTNPKAGFKGSVALKRIDEHVKKITKDNVTTILHFCANDKLAKYMCKKLNYKTADKVQTLAWVRGK